MFGAFPAIHGGAAAAAPDEIFGANLVGWYDAREGITLASGDVDDWADQSGSGNSLQTVTTGTRPEYVASDTDGTPSVRYNVGTGDVLQFAGAFPIGTLTTMYIFMNLPAADKLRGCAWSGVDNEGFYVSAHVASNRRPGTYNGSAWWQPAGSAVSGWTLFRFSADSANVQRLSVDDTADESSTVAWSPGAANWVYVGRNDSSQQLEGSVKQILFTDTFVTDADPEHQEVLDWIADLYPSLIAWTP